MSVIGQEINPVLPTELERERFDKFVEKIPGTECWFWTGALTVGSRYGYFYFRGGPQLAHRLALEWSIGKKIPAGMDACHSCDIRSCVNPDHLWPGTRKQNLQDASRKGRVATRINGRQPSSKRTHCPQGHEFSPETTAVYRTRTGRVNVGCRVCERARSLRDGRARAAKRRAQSEAM